MGGSNSTPGKKKFVADEAESILTGEADLPNVRVEADEAATIPIQLRAETNEAENILSKKIRVEADNIQGTSGRMKVDIKRWEAESGGAFMLVLIVCVAMVAIKRVIQRKKGDQKVTNDAYVLIE